MSSPEEELGAEPELVGLLRWTNSDLYSVILLAARTEAYNNIEVIHNVFVDEICQRFLFTFLFLKDR